MPLSVYLVAGGGDGDGGAGGGTHFSFLRYALLWTVKVAEEIFDTAPFFPMVTVQNNDGMLT